MYLRSIKIKNLRCFQNAELSLQYPGRELERPLKLPNINLLLGDNGAGKTTVLKAIALATLSPLMLQSGFVPYHLVRRERSSSRQPEQAEITAEVLLHAQDLGARKIDNPLPRRMPIRIAKRADTEVFVVASRLMDHWMRGTGSLIFDNDSPAFLVVGYSASRQVEDSRRFDQTARRKSRLLRYERVAGLFESYITLTPLESWLPGFRKENPGRHKQIVNLINRLLPEGASFAGDFEKSEYLFDINGAKIPFGALSDGYRAYIGWIADLLYHICKGAPSGGKLVETCGIVLVDQEEACAENNRSGSLLELRAYELRAGLLQTVREKLRRSLRRRGAGGADFAGGINRYRARVFRRAAEYTGGVELIHQSAILRSNDSARIAAARSRRI